jgi:hypothetical protein
MVMLVTMVIGVTALGTSIMEERMAANTQNSTVAFQAAETAIRGTTGNVDAMINSMGGTPVTQSFVITTGVTSNSTVTYGGETSIFGFSMGSGVSGHVFDINGNGQVPAMNAVSNHDQGVIQVGPGSP